METSSVAAQAGENDALIASKRIEPEHASKSDTVDSESPRVELPRSLHAFLDEQLPRYSERDEATKVDELCPLILSVAKRNVSRETIAALSDFVALLNTSLVRVTYVRVTPRTRVCPDTNDALTARTSLSLSLSGQLVAQPRRATRAAASRQSSCHEPLAAGSRARLVRARRQSVSTAAGRLASAFEGAAKPTLQSPLPQVSQQCI